MKRIRPIFLILVALAVGCGLVDRLFAPQVRAGEDRDHPGRRIRSRGVGQGLSPGIRLLAEEQGAQPRRLEQIPPGLDRRTGNSTS